MPTYLKHNVIDAIDVFFQYFIWNKRKSDMGQDIINAAMPRGRVVAQPAHSSTQHLEQGTGLSERMIEKTLLNNVQVRDRRKFSFTF